MREGKAAATHFFEEDIVTGMSTPPRPTANRLYSIPSIDTSVSRPSTADFSTYSSGWETPSSSQDRRRPSLTYSAFSVASPASSSLPTTPGYRVNSSNDTTPLYFDENAMRMMSCHKGGPSVMRPVVRHHGMSPFNMMSGDETTFQVPASLSPVCESFDTSFASSSTQPWSSFSEQPQTQQLGQPIVFRPSPNDSFCEQDHMSRAVYQESFQMQQCSQQTTPYEHCSQASTSFDHCQQPTSSYEHCPQPATYDNMASQQYFSPQQLIMPSAVQGSMYTQPMNLSMASTYDQPPMQSASFDSSTSFGSWSAGTPSPPMHDYAMSDDGLLRQQVKTEGSTYSSVPISHGFPSHMTDAAKRRRMRSTRGPTQRRGRTGSLHYVSNAYDVHLAIDTKGVEYNVEAQRYMKKQITKENKRWKCSVDGCESRSARKEHLRRHELSHATEKQFHCNLPKCNRAITRSDNLIQHLMTHARPSKAGKRNTHHSRERIERMIHETMTDKKLAERTITNLGKAIEREQDKWQIVERGDGGEWNSIDADD